MGLPPSFMDPSKALRTIPGMLADLVHRHYGDHTPLTSLRLRAHAYALVAGLSAVLLCVVGVVRAPEEDRGGNLLALGLFLPVLMLVLVTAGSVVSALLDEHALPWQPAFEKRMLSRVVLLLPIGSALAVLRSLIVAFDAGRDGRFTPLTRVLGATATGTVGVLAIVVGGFTTALVELSRRRRN